MDSFVAHMVCRELHVKNFRCFDSLTLSFERPLVLLEGGNGAGKTSILEALYYACYLRSFRTHLPVELIRFERDNFFVRVSVQNNDDMHHDMQVGFAQGKRSVKVDQKGISSYKELMSYYRVISLIEDDLTIIKGEPQARRSFIDQTILLLDGSYAVMMKQFRKIVSNRTRLIQQLYAINDNYHLWTMQLWEKSQAIQKKRTALIATILDEVRFLVATYFENAYTIHCSYETRYTKSMQASDALEAELATLFAIERKIGRCAFGAHLDDLTIQLEHKKTKRIASRGQQKLLVLLFKIAQARLITRSQGPVLFLLDDFMADFDTQTATRLIAVLCDIPGQIIFTTPVSNTVLASEVLNRDAQHIIVSPSTRTPL